MATPKAQVQRLVDMEVQEVSLVDRAANKRRFLVVKRSEGMGDKASSEATGADTTGEGSEGAGGADGGGAADNHSGAVVIALSLIHI